MRWRTTPKLQTWFALVVIGLVAGLAAGRPDVVVLVAPLAVALVAGILVARPELRVTTAVDRARIGEGESLTLSLTLTGSASVCDVEVAVVATPGLTIEDADRLQGIVLRGGESRTVAVPITAGRWGTYEVGEVWFRVRSRFELLVAEGVTSSTSPVIVYPQPESLRHLPTARRVQTAAGVHVAPVTGSGLELAGTRPAQPGARARDINWRATARRGSVWVYERHPERSTDVVVFLDAFGATTLAAAVRIADALATAYLANRDRVGLVSFGGSLRWVRPGMGRRQQYLIVDTLLSTRHYPSVARRNIRLVPPHVLPPRALVVAVTPLEDQHILDALTDLRSRGIDLITVEIAPLPKPLPGADEAEQIAHRLWTLERARTRDRYRSHGVPVVEWTGDEPLTIAIEEVQAWSRLRRDVASA